jgi:cell wall-associated NlpC family hydrolase
MKPGRILVGGFVLAVIAMIGLVTAMGGGIGITPVQAEVKGSAAICGNGGRISYTDQYNVDRSLTDAQAGILSTIVQTGLTLKVPRQGLIIGIATALQESGLQNLANANVPLSLGYPNDGIGHDHKSLGPFQQQLGMGWGNLDELMDPAWQAHQFFTRLLAVPGWQKMTETAAAQAVQISSFGLAYQAQVNSARQLLGTALGVVCPDSSVAGSGDRKAVVQGAIRWVGEPYAYAGGGVLGPSLGSCQAGAAAHDCLIVGFDCSGLVMYAYGRVGVTLPHDAAAQYGSGPHIDRAQLAPGDLLFLATNPSDPLSIHHVAIWIGHDSIVHAPQSGQKVAVVKHPFSQSWFASEYVGATRPTITGESK